MRFQEIALSTILYGATVLAAQLNERQLYDDFSAGLVKRQQFRPATTTAEGATCADAFGAGYETCREGTVTLNRLCYNPVAGQICCNSTWACPASSFCLATGSCCPSGQDPKVCAAQAASTSSNMTATISAGASGTKSSLTPTASTHGAASGSSSTKQAGSLMGLVGLLAGAMTLL